MTAYIDTLLSYCKSQGISEKDIVPVVRCKDCKYYGKLMNADPEADKTAIKDAINAGETVFGCKLVDKVSMIIK